MTVTEDARAATADGAPSAWVPAARAAQELALKRGEFDLAVHLGLITTGPVTGSARPRVGVWEIERLRAQPGFPAALREKVRTAGTAEGAALLGVTQVRFTALARVGCVSPVAFYLNRYRAVVWVYLVEELLAFAAQEPDLLSGRTPAGMRTMLEAGTDRRARNWRTRRIDRLLKQTRDPWGRAALEASALDPVQLAEVVDDPYERAYLARMQHAPAFGRPGSVSGREVMARLALADDPDEILWRRVNLTLELDRARDIRPAPRPGHDPVPESDLQRFPRRRNALRTEAYGDPGSVGGPYAAGAGRGTGRAGAATRPVGVRPTRRPRPGPGRGRRILARIGWRSAAR
ncbi:DUF6397 family protein [Streptomyces sp. NBC_01341]|uniref:DUF6397 family protein n=1 Tax=Streptomyces sp. NBC_01341 TaxID=2903831 RepID=UPI002E136F23|nr:DUF6397 family protein [Streptomyces sp. NBC_01341]